MADLPRVPRYAESGIWYKGNTHIHSTVSDGGLNFSELAAAYAGEGYDFLFRTDHWVASEVAAEPSSALSSALSPTPSPAPAPLLWLDGLELDGTDDQGGYYHVVCLGQFAGIEREMGFAAALSAAREQGGLLILAHPLWSGNTFEEALRHNFDGVEIYNHVCRWLNGKGNSLAYWQAMLKENPNTFGFASDDAHIRESHPGWNGGWVVVQGPPSAAQKTNANEILEGLRAGRFYSSTGPAFTRIVCDGARVEIGTSPIQYARLVGPAYLGSRVGNFSGSLFTEASFEVPADWPYAYVEIEDAQGRRAWTNTLLTAGQ
jgi:hypothetical protein